MKARYGIVAVAVCLTSVVSAQNVVTSGVFGVSRVEKPVGGLNMVGNSFAGIANTLDELAPVDQFSGSVFYNDADKVVIWDAITQAYTTYGLFDGRAYNLPLEWRDGDDWNSAASSSVVISEGSGFWVNSSTAASSTSLIISGAVVAEQTATRQIVTGLQMLANSFTSTMDLNSMDLKNGGTGSLFLNQADKVIVWDSTTQSYKTYGLFDGRAYNLPLEWRDGDAWNSDASAIPLELGSGFWYSALSGFTSVESNPYYSGL